ncbi:MAG: hypothetical protein WBN77_09395 [Desulfobacterales bacterium]
MFRRMKVLYLRVRSDGITAAIRWLITTVYHRTIPQKQVIWCTDITEINPEGFSIPDNLKIKYFYSIDQVDKEDLKTLTKYGGTELMGSAASSIIHDRFAKGAVLWLLKENGKLAGYRWTIVNKHMLPPYVPHTESDVHIIGTEVFPGFRDRELFQIFIKYSNITLKNEGFKRNYSETYLYNKRAVKAILKIGARKIGIARRFSFFGKNVVIWYDMTGKTDFL